MRVILSEAAQSDLEAIVDWIAQDSPQRADQFGEELVARCNGIGRNPRLYPIASNIATSGVRRRLHKGYLIFYSLIANEVKILHILNGARDYPALFADDDHTKL
jgi:toxin ParE1/3/4